MDSLFKRLTIAGWRQFASVNIDIHPRLTIITGANGAGKSSLLRIFSRHFGFDRPFLSTPKWRNGGLIYDYGLFKSFVKAVKNLFIRFHEHSGSLSLGEVEYDNGQSSPIRLPSVSNGTAQYVLDIPSQQAVSGLHVDSHHAVNYYQSVGSIPASYTDAAAAYQIYNAEIASRFGGNSHGHSPIYRMKESIIAMAIFGEKTSRSAGNPKLKKTLDDFVVVLKKILPPTLGFKDLVVRNPEVVVQTEAGEFLIDAASGGIATLLDISWRLHLFSQGKEKFVVTMDEPENHLHPSMQRSLMNRLLDAFPKAQFIVATHSPFIVSSVRDSYVYVLRYEGIPIEDTGEITAEFGTTRIVSEKLDSLHKSASANQILREVLGVEATVPEWVVNDVQDVVRTATRSHPDMSMDLLKSVREKLDALGYTDQYPHAVAQITKHYDRS